MTLPVIACHADGSFFVIGRKSEAAVVVGLGNGMPTPWSPEELDAQWTGEILFAVRPKPPIRDAVTRAGFPGGSNS